MKIINEAIQKLKNQEEVTWAMVRACLENRDASEIVNMGAKLQALQRAKSELEKLYEA